MLEPGCLLDLESQRLRGGEWVDMTAAAGQPTIEFVGEGGRVRDRNIESAVRFEYTANFGQGILEFLDVLEAMVGDYEVERVSGEGQARRVSLNKVAG
jgi:hypothetical protein